MIQQDAQQDPDEAIVVLYDTSGSMVSPMFFDPSLKRFGAVSAFFSEFADKMIAFELNNII